MRIKTENYQIACGKIPAAGQYILGHQEEDQIVVYQAYKPAIANFAVKNQCLGGSDYSYNRMSWIKPNFLWMMYRCGWAEKENQERVLALWINKSVLQDILSNAVLSSYDAQYYASHEAWKHELNDKEVRLQWDPDHDPYGNKQARRAIQLGLKGELLKEFGKNQLRLVEDITDFVKEQKQLLDSNQLEKLTVPVERVWEIDDAELKKRVGID
jgi:hypothetical protein